MNGVKAIAGAALGLLLAVGIFVAISHCRLWIYRRFGR